MRMRKGGIRFATAVSAVAISAAVPVAAQAQSGEVDAGSTQEIVVTALKRDQKIQDVGLSITAIPADRLRTAAITSSQDIAKLTTNLVVQNTTAGEAPSYALRGVSSGAAEFSVTAQPVALHVDGVYLSSNAMGSFALFDVARVEVLKGPQGTLFGKNTTGGVVNYITSKPELNNSGSLDLSYERFNTFRATLVQNAKVSDNTAIRLSAFRESGDGYLYNSARKARTGGADIWGGRLAIQSQLSDNWSILANVHGFSDRSYALQQVPRGLVGAGCTTGPKGFVPSLNCADDAGYKPVSADPFTSDWSLDRPKRNGAIGGYMEINGDLGFANFTSVSGFDHFHRNLAEDEDGGSLTSVDFTRVENIDQFSQEVRLSSKAGSKATWIVGALAMVDKLTSERSLPNSAIIGIDIGFFGRNKTRTYALFADGAYPLTDTFKLVGGLRYSWETKDATVNNAFYNLGTLESANPVILAQRCSFAECDKSQTFKALSGRAGVEYRPAPGYLLYGTYSRGFKSGGFPGGVTIRPTTFIPYDNEFVDAFEAGLKTSGIAPGLVFNLAGFYYKYKNKQEYSLLPNLVQIFQNAASATLYGAEAEFSYYPGNGLEVDGGIGLLHTNYDSYNVPEQFRGQPGITDLTGRDFALAPTLTGNFSIAYKFAVGSSTVRPSFSVRYQSSTWFTPENVNYLAEKGYAVSDARIDWNLADKRFTVSAYGRNLFDKRYRTQVFLSPVNSIYMNYAAPVTYGVSLRVKY